MQIERTPEDLSALIIRGSNSPRVTENHSTFIDRNPFGGYKACALGMAYIEMVGDPDRAYVTYYNRVGLGYSPIRFLANELGITVEMALKVSNMHCAGEMKAKDIAQRIIPLKVVAEIKAKKPSMFERLRAWWNKPQPQPQPQLRLVTNS